MKFCASTQMRGDVVPMVGEAFADRSEGRGEVVLDDKHAHGSQHNVNRLGTNETMDEGVSRLAVKRRRKVCSGARSVPTSSTCRRDRPAEVRLTAQVMRPPPSNALGPAPQTRHACARYSGSRMNDRLDAAPPVLVGYADRTDQAFTRTGQLSLPLASCGGAGVSLATVAACPAAMTSTPPDFSRRRRQLEMLRACRAIRPSRAHAGVRAPTRSRTRRAPLRSRPGCPWL